MKILQTAVLVTVSFLMLGTSSANEAWAVRADGAGPLRIGMTLPQVNKALGESFAAPADRNQADCFYVTTSKPTKLLLMMMDGGWRELTCARRESKPRVESRLETQRRGHGRRMGRD